MASLRLQAFKTALLEPIDLRIDGGECISLSGPSGCGKTRLLRAIADLDPHQGEAFVDDAAQSGMSGPTWRGLVGLLPAESFWWSSLVGEHFQDMRDSLLAQLGFADDVSNWEISRLSSGERQRLSLARLLLNQPGVLLLDEPTANLDRDNIQLVEDLIKHWRHERGGAVLWVSHDPEQQTRVASRHFVIENGKLRQSPWN